MNTWTYNMQDGILLAKLDGVNVGGFVKNNAGWFAYTTAGEFVSSSFVLADVKLALQEHVGRNGISRPPTVDS